MKQPVDHILRPTLPWRASSAITECGYDASSVSTLSRAEYFARLKDLGQQRSAMVTCMTCAQTAARWDTWEGDPRKAVEREIQWETAWSRSERGDLLRDELVAIASLIEAHRDEFETIMAANEQRRAWIAQKAALATKAARKPTRPRGGL